MLLAAESELCRGLQDMLILRRWNFAPANSPQTALPSAGSRRPLPASVSLTVLGSTRQWEHTVFFSRIYFSVCATDSF